MFKTVIYKIWPKTINFPEKIKTMSLRIKKQYGLKNAHYGYRQWDNSFHVKIDVAESYVCDSEDEFYQVLENHISYKRFSYHLCLKKRLHDDRFGLGIDFDGTEVEVQAHSSKLEFIDHVITLIQNEFGLEKGIKADSDNYRRKMLEPTIFISRHFDKTGNEYFSRISEPLSRLGFYIEQGENYSSTGIPDKVKHLIDKQDIECVPKPHLLVT